MKLMKRYLLIPFHSVPLILVGTFTFLWWFAIQAGLFGIPLMLILVSWFFKYCYVLLDAVVAGHNEPPVLSVEMLNPIDEQRPLFQAVMVVFEGLVCWWLYQHVGHLAGFALGAVFLTALPATVGLLAVSDSWVHALSPLAIWRIMKGLGRVYLATLAVILAGALLIGFVAPYLGLLTQIALCQLVFIAMFAFIGGAIHESRVDLQLATRTHGERVAERDERYHAEERGAVLDRTYSLLRLKRRSDAWANLEIWMRQHCPDSHPFTEYHALLVATCSWDDPAIGDKVATEYLGKLLASGETGMVLEALEIRLASNANFYPAGQPYATRLTELVRLSGRKALSRQLLANGAAPISAPGAGSDGPSKPAVRSDVLGE
jgi:hypothetical protein